VSSTPIEARTVKLLEYPNVLVLAAVVTAVVWVLERVV